jgi:hypothetical protein
MGELREVQLTRTRGLAGAVFLKTVKDTTVRIYALTFAKQIPTGLECRPQLASLS